MTQLIELSEQFIHHQDNVFTLLFDYRLKVTNVAKQYGNFIFLLLEGEVLCVVFKVLFDEFRHENGENVVDIMGFLFEGLVFDKVDFGLNERISQNNDVHDDTDDCEQYLKSDLAFRLV